MPTIDFGLTWLQLALAHLDILLHRQMQRFAQSSLQNSVDAPLERYFVTEAQVYSLLYQRAGYNAPDLQDTENNEYTQALVSLERRMAAVVEEAAQSGAAIPFRDLGRVFSLSQFEQDLLLAVLAPEIDARYGKIYGYLNNNPSADYATVDLLIDLFAPPGLNRLSLLPWLAREGTLARSRLVEVVEPAATASRLRAVIKPDPGLASWLFGVWQAPAMLREQMTLEEAPAADLWMLSPEVQIELGSAAGGGGVIVLHGRERLAMQSAAALIGALADLPILTTRLAGIPVGEALAEAVELTLRDARMTRAIPHFVGWERTQSGEGLSHRLQESLLNHPSIVILSGAMPWHPTRIVRQRSITSIHFPAPVSVRRRYLLEHYLRSEASDIPLDAAPDALSDVSFEDAGETLAGTSVTDADLTVLANQFLLTGEQWRDVVYAAKDAARQARQSLLPEHLFAASRAQSSPGLMNLAHKVTPRYDWDDLILPPDALSVLHEIVNTVRQRGFVLEEWGLGKSLVAGSGVATLFSGPPGTGKTMAASVLARHLGLDLYKIDLSGVVSKYIGETEKNLERIFSEAEESNAILFFDEADAIFGKRSEVSDAHDRHANIEVSYLLQRMETYSGVTILATNLRGNLDEAFFRRLQFVVDLPFPEYEDRLRIWQSLYPKDVPTAEDIDLSLLARRFKFAGGNIRNVLVTAAFQAAANGRMLTMEHLFHGARREMQKMGRIVDERDLRMPVTATFAPAEPAAQVAAKEDLRAEAAHAPAARHN